MNASPYTIDRPFLSDRVPAGVPAGRSSTSALTYFWRRLAVGAALVAVLVLGALAVLAAISDPAGADLSPGAETTTVVVQPGDTLWSIAGSLGIDGDRRDVVVALADANGGANLSAGQTLVVPVTATSVR